jgi:hypothetical protein
MKTEELIGVLAARTQPVPSYALVRRVMTALTLGGLVTLTCVVAFYGLRDDLTTAALGGAFWLKVTFTVGVAVFGFLAIERAARPGVRLDLRLALLAMPFVFILASAGVELAHTSQSERITVWLGQTARTCPFSIAGLALPPLALLLLALRRLAPTRPTLAGFVAGLCAGGLAATAYGLHCPERSPAFVATWYALGILGSGALGAVLGRKLLRW